MIDAAVCDASHLMLIHDGLYIDCLHFCAYMQNAMIMLPAAAMLDAGRLYSSH